MADKLLIVGSTLDRGGIQSVISNLSLELRKAYEIDILLNNKEKITYPYGGNIISLNVKQSDNAVNLWFQFKVFVKRCILLHKLKKSAQYIACLSMMDSANIANIITRTRLCKTVIAVYTNITSGSFRPEYKYIVGPLAKIFYNKADKIVVTSKGVMKDLEMNYKIRPEIMQVIYDGINIHQVAQNAKESLSEHEKKMLGKYTLSALGRLDYSKGYGHLIRAMKVVRESYPFAKLLIMGTGNLQNELEQLIRECGLEDYVVLCGYTINPYKLIANSSIFVMSSIVEGFPTVLMEAITCGTPVISTDMESGAREILAPDSDFCKKNTSKIEQAEYGILVPADDESRLGGNVPLTKSERFLGQAIVELLGNTNLQNEYRAKYKSRYMHFSVETCAKEWERMLHSL